MEALGRGLNIERARQSSSRPAPLLFLEEKPPFAYNPNGSTAPRRKYMPANSRVYGIGNILIDALVRVTDDDILKLELAKGTMHLTEGAERLKILSFIKTREATYNCGGSAPNVVITLAGLQVPSALSGRIGPDEFGEIYDERLSEHGVESFLHKGEGSTGSSVIMITPDSERTMNTHLGVNRDYSLDDINPEAIAGADYFFFTGYMWDTPNQKKALTKAMEVAKSNGTKIVFDAADPFAVTRHHGDFLHLIENHFDVVLANREEAKLIFNDDDIDSCVNKLAALCDTAIVKDGPRGSYIKEGTQTHRIPVNTVHAVDTTGAGDIYAAGFIFGLSQKWDTAKAGKFASYLASQIVCVTGAQFSVSDIKRLNQELKDDSWDNF